MMRKNENIKYNIIKNYFLIIIIKKLLHQKHIYNDKLNSTYINSWTIFFGLLFLSVVAGQ